jgi:hypothetical protein
MQYMTTGDYAARYGLTQRQARTLALAGDVPAIRVGGARSEWRFLVPTSDTDGPRPTGVDRGPSHTERKPLATKVTSTGDTPVTATRRLVHSLGPVAGNRAAAALADLAWALLDLTTGPTEPTRDQLAALLAHAADQVDPLGATS